MNFQIKSLSGVLSEEEKRVIRKSLLPLENLVENSAVLTVGVKQHITKKSNRAYELLAHLIAPGKKRPIYAKVFRNSLEEAVNLAKEKIERQLLKPKGRLQRISIKDLFARHRKKAKNGTA